MKTIEEACCVVTASETPLDLSSGSQNKAMSCSGVFVNSQYGIVVCTGIVFSEFINEHFAKNDSNPLYFDNFCKHMKVYVDYTKRTDVSDNCNQRIMDRPNVIRQEAKLLMMVNCLEFQDAFHKIFKRADNWGFYSGSEDTGVLKHSRFLSWFAFLKVPTSSTFSESVPWLKSCNLKKGFAVLACGSPFGGLCPDLFMNTISKGIVSNLAGDENALILTDARCLPGTEGGGLFVSQEDRAYLVGLIISPLCWKSDEWIGLTLVCSVHLILKNMLKVVESQKSLTKMSSEFIYNSLQAPLTNNVRSVCGCERYPDVVLIDAGYLWGSGVLLNQQLVLTCRHVVNDKSVLTVKANMGGRFHTVSGEVLYSSAPSSPYDIAVVKLQEPVLNLLTPRFATHFNPGEDVVVIGYGALGGSSGPSLTSGILSRVITHQSQPVMLQTTCAVQSGASGGAVVRPSTGELLGVVSSNTRDFSAKVTYPHLNFSIPVTVLEPLLRLFAQTGNDAVFKALDNAEEDVRKTWRLQSIQSKL
ncbi:peroxisomal leader peptide-processing protease [Triplophysa rosa]|uniref:Peroxisomal leader peptide-processing protease n=1 Tax=Triplophysa rosa TaxID=992332 RepID=A0A9W7WNJ6_TRIRA|nr:peroxisomal leader peptide-processing protease [Triplophysa rosa]KAI7805444.1 peroxisomal leader peptide-processing protease [Triplophysa rosa]